ncbi:L,D-transpeptidase [Oceanicaulis sp. LC35]|uniref:L,D-transpeptidase family protein n=1 Tax=Oceanicaulis sp. LC35 TaxID=3349635 RepID=UPI003F8457BC
MPIYSASASRKQLQGPDFTAPCAIGRSGVIEAEKKTEGDGMSPIGRWSVRRAYWRADRIDKPETGLVIDPIRPDDGWCDAPQDPAYNQPVRLPYPASYETMTREDGLYDLVVVLGHNDDPPKAGLGSAIFLHCASPAFKPTEGCVAIERSRLIELVSRLTPRDWIEIAP